MLFHHRVIENQVLNSKFNLITLKAKKKDFLFNPGQFVNIVINEHTFRFYSIASSPEKLPVWQIFVDILPGGPGSSFLKNLKRGDLITTSNPQGQFLLSQNPKGYLFGATGCGIAPFLPMFEKLCQNSQKKVHLFWGLRKENEITLNEELKNLEKQNPNFRYDVVLSEPDDHWTGKVGHVPSEITKEIHRSGQRDVGVYLSGSNDFIAETNHALLKMKIPAHKIYFEACGI